MMPGHPELDKVRLRRQLLAPQTTPTRRGKAASARSSFGRKVRARFHHTNPFKGGNHNNQHRPRTFQPS